MTGEPIKSGTDELSAVPESATKVSSLPQLNNPSKPPPPGITETVRALDPTHTTSGPMLALMVTLPTSPVALALSIQIDGSALVALMDTNGRCVADAVLAMETGMEKDRSTASSKAVPRGILRCTT